MDFNTVKMRLHNKYLLTKNKLLGIWLRLLESGHSLSDLFVETDSTNVAIFLSAPPDAIALLIEDLKRFGVSIKYFVNDLKRPAEPFESYGIDIVNIAELAGEAVDFVITFTEEDLFEADKLLRNANPSSPIEVVCLGDLLSLGVDRYMRFYPYASQLPSADIKILLLGWAEIRHFRDAKLRSGPYSKPFSRELCQGNPPHFADLYADIAEYSDEYISQVFSEVPIITSGETQKHADHRSSFLNVVNGMRLTTDQPEHYDHTVHVFGFCLGFGYGADDKRTFASCLQRHLNEPAAGRGVWRVVNRGVWGGALSLAEGGRIIAIPVKNGEIRDGDIVIDISMTEYHPYTGVKQPKIASYVTSYLKRDFHVDFINLYDVLLDAHLREKIYIDPTHVNHRGYSAIARHVFDGYIKDMLGDDPPCEQVADIDYSSLPWRWGELSNKRRSPAELFQQSGASVAIYSPDQNDARAVAFSNELKSLGINPQRFTLDDDISGVDFIVDTDGALNDETALSICDRTGAEVVSLEEAVDIMYDRCFLLEPLADATSGGNYRVCALGWACAKDLGADLVAKDYPPISSIRNNPAYLSKLYNEIREFSPAYVKELFAQQKIMTGSLPYAMGNISGQFLNIKDGMRVTRNQPPKWDNTIHIFGGGAAFGVGADDRFTIASCLQEHINQRADGSQNDGAKIFKVANHGLWDGSEDTDILAKSLIPLINNGLMAAGDIALYLVRTFFHQRRGRRQKRALDYIESYTRGLGLIYLDLAPAIKLVEDKNGAYFNNDYVNARCYKTVSSKIYIDCVKNILDGTEIPPGRTSTPDLQDDPELSGEQNAEFRQYLESLRGEKTEAKGVIGAIVMNCNPFTLGHRYLVERAAAEADLLYVFVVEEDKSFFKFDDRYKLVSDGLSDLKNVKVLRSGKFIISTITFPGYFTKESASEIAVDTSLDLRLFGKYIVPALNIGVRYAGSEPTDAVTRQYNRAMSETLPRYGVKFVEFERVTKDESAISASRVRELLKEQKFDEIRKLVPDVTYRYLLGHFSGEPR
jgi:[citrate (pro-3S)-lyase] ligase